MVTSRKSSLVKGKQAGARRKSPGSTGQGEYYHVEVRPGQDFVTYRTGTVHGDFAPVSEGGGGGGGCLVACQ